MRRRPPLKRLFYDITDPSLYLKVFCDIIFRLLSLIIIASLSQSRVKIIDFRYVRDPRDKGVAVATDDDLKSVR